MFDYLPKAAQDSTPTHPRLFAMRFLSSSAARLTRAAGRLGGEAGVALAQALRDMMIDPAVDPMHWPIDDMLAILRRPGAERDVQVDRLIATLSYLRGRIDASLA
jgi:hypothetical protein